MGLIYSWQFNCVYQILFLLQSDVILCVCRVMSCLFRKSYVPRSFNQKTHWHRSERNTKCFGLSLNRTSQPMSKQVTILLKALFFPWKHSQQCRSDSLAVCFPRHVCFTVTMAAVRKSVGVVYPVITSVIVHGLAGVHS